jgi:hypothetical protein
MIPGVTVDTAAIRTLATKVDELFGKYVKASSDALATFLIKPGDFADGQALDTYAKDRVTELKTALQNLGNAMTQMKIGLNDIAGKYDDTADKTNDIATELDTIVKNITSSLPGFEA